MSAIVTIPKAFMGHTIHETAIKAVLMALNPEIHFDMGTCLNIWHPYRDTRQNVFFRGKSLVGMDRGVIPEVPIWSTKKDMVEIPLADVRIGEISMARFAGLICHCQKCGAEWDMPHKIAGHVICPNLCGNMGHGLDETLFVFRAKPTETAWVFRQVKDRVILVGWRHTLHGVLRRNVPGVTKQELESKLKINLDAECEDDAEVLEAGETRMLDQRIVLAGAA